MATISKGKSPQGEPQEPKKELPEMAHEQTIVPEHPSIDSSGRFATDRLIRSLGYRIWRRKGKQEAIWKGRDGVEIAQSKILSRLPKGMLSDAKCAEDLYLDGKYIKE